MTKKLSDEQKIFNKVSKHLLLQNERSVTFSSGCRYRGEDGLKCAIGCLIKDEVYSSDLEGNGVQSPDVVAALVDSGVKVTPETYELMSRLQEIHDESQPSEWPRLLVGLGIGRGLDTSLIRIP